mgnify:FL=1
MKAKQYLKMLTVLAALPALALSCTDAWDDHYGDGTGAGTNVDAPTLLEHVQADAELAQFLRVVKHVGYDAVLESPQMFTLWVPVITEQQADSVIAVYEAQKLLVDNNGNLRKDKDNYAITQFIQNHIALAGRSASKLTRDSVRMWNGKYMVMTDQDLDGVPYLDKNIVASNGIMYKLREKETFFPNLREVLELQERMDSASHFFKMFDEYTLDEQQSVMQDIVDGEIVYADSVMTLSNSLYHALGYIQREDSAYIYLAPSNEEWKREYDKYYTWFSYVNDSRIANRDSLIQLNARFAIARGRFFNINTQKNEYKDSITNTYYVRSKDYFGLNRFLKPKDEKGILYGLTPVKCSNGYLYEDAEGRIPDSLTFNFKRYLSPLSRSNWKARLIENKSLTDTYSPQVNVTTRNIVESVTLKTQTGTEVDPESGEEVPTYDEQVVTFPELRDKQYVEVEPATYSGTTNTTSNIYFYLRNTFSNLYYNVYVVMVPEFARENYDATLVLPVPFRVSFSERTENAGKGIVSREDPESGEFSREVTLTTSNTDDAHKTNASTFLATGTGVDLICIDKARKFNFASYNAFASLDGTQRYRFQSQANATQLKNKLYSNILRINRIIYIPFETEEEAKAFDLQLSDLSNLKEYKQ